MSANLPPCTTCGRPSYQTVRLGIRATAPRCFPHAVPPVQSFKKRVQDQLRAEERYALEHIDRGFSVLEKDNDAREAAYGGHLIPASPYKRLGFDR